MRESICIWQTVKFWVSRIHDVMTRWCVEFTPRLLHHDRWRQGGCFVTTQYHVVQISQSENRNSFSVWNLSNKKVYVSFVSLRPSVFHEPRVSGTLRLGDNKTHCFPRDRSWSVLLYLSNSKIEKKLLRNPLITPTVSQDDLRIQSCVSNNKLAFIIVRYCEIASTKRSGKNRSCDLCFKRNNLLCNDFSKLVINRRKREHQGQSRPSKDQSTQTTQIVSYETVCRIN